MAISNDDSTLFTMDLKLVEIIKNDFDKIYEEMAELGVIKHKKHFISIHDRIRGINEDYWDDMEEPKFTHEFQERYQEAKKAVHVKTTAKGKVEKEKDFDNSAFNEKNKKILKDF